MSIRDDIFEGYGVEIQLRAPEDFLKVKETLTRIGVESKRTKTLFQSCHILHKRGRYSILHFKELFCLDGKGSSITENDILRRNTIVSLLSEWGLVDLVDPAAFEDMELAPMGQIKVISFAEKANWALQAKYNIGIKKRR